MEITYIGHSCFKIRGKNSTLVTDPYDPAKTGYKLPKLEADIVLVSHSHADHSYIQGVSNHSLLIQTPGEYEKNDVTVYGLESFHDDSKGLERGKNTIFVIEIDGFTILHLGDLGHQLDKETLEKIPNIDVLMIPVGGTYTIDAKEAVKVISDLEPGIAIPMHYQTDDLTGLSKKLESVEVFLHEMGADGNVKSVEKLKLSGRSDVPSETSIVVLNSQI